MPIGLVIVLSFLCAACTAVWTAVAIRERKVDQPDPILPSELDDWDAEFTQRTGKSIWEAQCEANPELCRSIGQPGTAENNINPYYNDLMRQMQGQIYGGRSQAELALLQQQAFNNPYAAQLQQQHGLLGGLGNSLGGLFH